MATRRIQRFVDAENAYAQQLLDSLRGKDKLRARLEQLVTIGRVHIPGASRTRMCQSNATPVTPVTIHSSRLNLTPSVPAAPAMSAIDVLANPRSAKRRSAAETMPPRVAALCFCADSLHTKRSVCYASFPVAVKRH